MKLQPMFYDEIVKPIVTKYKLTGKSTEQIEIDRGSPPDVTNTVRLLDVLANEARIFYIDELILDSLSNVRYDSAVYRTERHLPFDFLFFEFGRTIPFDLCGHQYDIGGILLNKLSNTTFLPVYGGYDGYLCCIFDKQDEIPFVSSAAIITDVRDIFMFIEECRSYRNYKFVMRDRVYQLDIDDETLPSHASESHVKEVPAIEYEPPEDESILDPSRLGNFALNVVDYINADNVVIRERNRNRPDLERVNRRREGKGKPRLPELKSYYFLEVTKRYLDPQEGRGGWTLNHRVWVRGHFRHYQSGATIWIDPYVRGPPDAPWKHNRYLMLYNRFKHLLKSE